MLTKEEVCLVGNDVSVTLADFAYMLLLSETKGDMDSEKSLNALETMLYTFALGDFNFGSATNTLEDFQIREIYTRLQTLKNK